jgi:hypothetical protein
MLSDLKVVLHWRAGDHEAQGRGAGLQRAHGLGAVAALQAVALATHRRMSRRQQRQQQRTHRLVSL